MIWPCKVRWVIQPSLQAAWCSQPPRAHTFMSNTASMLFLEQFSANLGFFLVNFIITIILWLTWCTNACLGHSNLPTTDWDTERFVKKHDFEPIYKRKLLGGTNIEWKSILLCIHAFLDCKVWWSSRSQNPIFVSSVTWKWPIFSSDLLRTSTPSRKTQYFTSIAHKV